MTRILQVCFVLCCYCTSYAQTSSNNSRSLFRTFDTQKYQNIYKVKEDNISTSTIHATIDDIEAQIKLAEKDIVIQPITIQLVFHLLHSDDIDNAKKQMDNQIDALNRDFSNKSLITDHPNDPDGTFQQLAADTQLTFEISDEHHSSLMHHTEAMPSSSWTQFDDMKKPSKGGVRSMDPSQLINIWVVHLPEGISSYASSIYTDIDSDEDGIVLDAKYFIQDKTTPYNQGKTLTHLMGNYLGLYDLWSDDRHCQDDYVEDTPIHNALNYGKPIDQHISTCPSENFGREMVMNFMDNSDDEIQTMFTKGQVKRMHTVLHLLRKGLVTSIK